MGLFDIDPRLLQGLDFNNPQSTGFRQKLMGLLGGGPDDPQTQGLLGLSSALLQASGPSTMPTSIGQALGKGIEGYSKGRQQGFQNKLQERLINAKTMAGGANMNDEAAIKRYLFRKGLPESDQHMFDQMVRAQQTLNLGGQQVVLDPSGGVRKTYAVTPRPDQMPDFRAAQTAAETQAKVSTESRETAKSSLGDTLDEINKMRDSINGLVQSPGFDTAYGLSGKIDPRNYIPGTDAANTSARREQLDAMSFGIAIQKMKGTGSLSDAEGKKVSAAFTRATNPKIDPQEARKAWSEVLQIMDSAERRAYEKAGAKPPARQSTPPQSGGIQFLGFE